MKLNMFENMCRSACYGIMMLDKQGRIVFVNDFCTKLLALPSDAGSGASFLHEFIPSEEHSTYNKIFNIYPDIIYLDQPSVDMLNPVHIEFEKPHPGGLMATLLKFSICPLYEESMLVGYSVWINDISRRKKLLTQLDQAEKLASLATLASGIAHHFNNIIGGVATFADFALAGNNPQAYQKALKMTIEAAERISQITSSLLTFAEQDSREIETSDLSEVVLTFCHLVEKDLCEKNIILELNVGSVPEYEVPGAKINQILNNIVSNAEEAMPEGGTLSINLIRDEGNLVLTFADTGCGIEQDHLPHIFNPFFTTRGVASNGQSTHKSGLGLSVVYGIVKEMRGSISAFSKLECGSEFIIKLPLQESK